MKRMTVCFLPLAALLLPCALAESAEGVSICPAAGIFCVRTGDNTREADR